MVDQKLALNWTAKIRAHIAVRWWFVRWLATDACRQGLKVGRHSRRKPEPIALSGLTRRVFHLLGVDYMCVQKELDWCLNLWGRWVLSEVYPEAARVDIATTSLDKLQFRARYRVAYRWEVTWQFRPLLCW